MLLMIAILTNGLARCFALRLRLVQLRMHLATIVPNVVKVPSLARCRSAATLSQRELATKAGVSHVTVARLEGGHDAHPRTIRKLAEALEVRPADLMSQPSEG